MRVVVVGATGNVGTSVLRALEPEDRVESILGVARRRPGLQMPKVEWAEADVVSSDFAPLFEGADAVVCLAWLIQPSRDLNKLWMVNVEGTMRVAEAAARAGVGAFLYASSVGAYSPGPKDRRVDESWPTGGIPTSYYGRQKAEVERRLDAFEGRNPEMRVVRMRQALTFKRDAAEGQRRLFAGPFLPSPLVHPALINVVPAIENLRGQVVHSHDVGEAYRLALLNENARGAYNLATELVVDPEELGRIFNARTFPLPGGLARAGAAFAWGLRLTPVSPGWLDMALSIPIMDTTRAREELGWDPQYDAGATLLDEVEGLRTESGLDTPPLAKGTSGPFRIREILTGIGGREP